MSQALNGLILDNYHLLSTFMSGTVPKSFHILYNKEGIISSLCNLNSVVYSQGHPGCDRTEIQI